MRDLVRSLVAAMLSPAMIVSFPVVRLVARLRRHARLRPAAGSHAEHAPSAARALAAATAPADLSNDPAAEAGRAPRATARIGITSGRAGHATRHEPQFSTVRVDPPSAKLLDLTAARMLSADMFEQLADAWTAPPDAVPRLGIEVFYTQSKPWASSSPCGSRMACRAQCPGGDRDACHALATVGDLAGGDRHAHAPGARPQVGGRAAGAP